MQDNERNLNNGLTLVPLGKSTDGIENIEIDSAKIHSAVSFLKENPTGLFDILFSVTAVDYTEYFEVVYHLYSSKFSHGVILKAKTSRENPEIDSISDIFTAADWHEREVFDLFGIKFNNHPNLTRILMPQDWIGHPMRKDYVLNDERLAWNTR